MQRPQPLARSGGEQGFLAGVKGWLRLPLLAVGMAGLVVGSAGMLGVATSSARPTPGGGPRVVAGEVSLRNDSPDVGGRAWAVPLAHTAHTLSVNDEGHLHSVRSAGAELVEEGPISGTIRGKVRVSFIIGATITAKFTIYPNGGGTLSGHGGGTLHSTSRESSFGGSLTVTGGSGRYAHAHGKGSISGKINRTIGSYPMVVRTSGTLYY